MKKIILIGGSGSGKTSLVQGLLGREIQYRKTQALNYYDYILDTPGEYLENKRFYNSLLVSSANYPVVGLVQDSTSEINLYPPKFATMFGNKEVIGIITKSDSPDRDIKRAEKILKSAGAGRIIVTSAMDRTGLEELKGFLKE